MFNFLNNVADFSIRIPHEISLVTLAYAIWTVSAAQVKMKFMRRDLNNAFTRIRKLEGEKDPQTDPTDVS